MAIAGAAGVTLAAAGTLVAGFTFGLFSGSASSGNNTFTAGTVTVGPGNSGSVTCNISNMVPGDSSTGAPIGSKTGTACTYNVKYTGSATGWLGVDVTVANGSTALYNGSNTGLQLYMKDGTPTTYLTSTAPTAGTTYVQEGGASTSLPTGTTSNLLVSKTPATTGTDVVFTLDYAVPIATSNSFQGGSATVTLTFHAVQSGNNPLPSDCAAGQQCNASSTFAWS
jgi:hypothetical protein